MYRHHRIAHQEIEQTGQRWIEAQLNRVRGELLIRHKPAEIAAAGDAFMRSVAVARRQQTKTFELQAATSVARLWRDQGKAKEARTVGSGVRVVHGGVRHARSERGEGVVEGIGFLRRLQS